MAIQRSLPILILRSKVKDDSADDLVNFCAPAGCFRINVSRIRRNLTSRGESGWRSDWTSTPGAWRHAGARFLLSGDWVNNPGGIRARNLQLIDKISTDALSIGPQDCFCASSLQHLKVPLQFLAQLLVFSLFVILHPRLAFFRFAPLDCNATQLSTLIRHLQNNERTYVPGWMHASVHQRCAGRLRTYIYIYMTTHFANLSCNRGSSLRIKSRLAFPCGSQNKCDLLSHSLVGDDIR